MVEGLAAFKRQKRLDRNKGGGGKHNDSFQIALEKARRLLLLILSLLPSYAHFLAFQGLQESNKTQQGPMGW